MSRQVKRGLALAGLVGFAILMALRSEVSGTAARSAIAAGAFVCAAVALVSMTRAWR